MAERFDGVACGKFHSPTASCRLHCLRQVTSYFSCVRDCNSTLPLFIEGNWRVSENRQRACSLSVEREPVRVRFGLNTPEGGGSLIPRKTYFLSILGNILIQVLTIGILVFLELYRKIVYTSELVTTFEIGIAFVNLLLE